MQEWPTVRQVCRNLKLRQSDITDNEGEYYGTQSYNVVPPEPFGDHEIYATTKEVDMAWCEYYREINRICTCGHH